MKPKFRISYRKGRRLNAQADGETGYAWSIIDRDDLVLASGWSAGRKGDAVAEAERKLDEIAAMPAVHEGVS
jgi:hypothetical protein